MDGTPAFSDRTLRESGLDRRSLSRRLSDWVVASRSHRVLCVVGGLCLINVFDLILTLLSHSQGLLSESNPIARHILPMGPQVVAMFKLALVGGACAVLVHFRRMALSEFTSLLMFLVYAGVAIRWKLCYELYTLSVTSGASQQDLDMLNAYTAGIPLL